MQFDPLKRREFITLLGGGAGGACAAVGGFLYSGSPDLIRVRAFHQGLNEIGCHQVTVIAACGTSASGLAAKAATSWVSPLKKVAK